MHRLSTTAVAAIVVLRLAIGFHFYYEGAAKLKDPKPFSSMFLGAAKGPLAGFYQSMVYDPDGEARLDDGITGAAWDKYVERAKSHYRFGADQVKAADEALDQRKKQLAGYLASISSELDEYKQGIKYLRTANDPDRQFRKDDGRTRVGVASLKGQWDKTEAELKGKRGPWLSSVDKISKGLERDIQSIAGDSGNAAVRMDKPGQRFMDSETVDRIIPYFDLTVGVLLVIGLFTRTAAFAGAAFLASVVLSQWPGATGAISTAYQTIEMLALLVIVALNAGQLAGIDFFIANCCGRKCAGAK